VYKVPAAICFFSLVLAARANEVIVNGGFETGNLAGWTTTDSGTPGDGWSVTAAPVTPLNGFPTVGPNSGSFYAVTDMFNPGSHALSQSFTAAANTDYVLSFNMFVNDQFGGSGLGGEANLLAGGANPITGTPLKPFTRRTRPWLVVFRILTFFRALISQAC
jgi:hypothetical protein